MLLQHETAIFEQRETIRRETANLEMQQDGSYQSLDRVLNAEQKEELTRALKDGKLPFSMEVAEPETVRGQIPSEKGTTKTKAASTQPKGGSTTLSR